MRKLISTAAVLAILAPVAARADELKSFEHGRDTYVYQTETARSGATVITGRRKGGDRFRLVVDGTRVTGHVGGTPVAFSTPQRSAASVMTAN